MQLSELLAADSSALFDELAPVDYQGMGARFSDRRWWRLGVESRLWKGTDGQSQSATAIHEFLERISGVDIVECGFKEPVVCYDENFVQRPDFASMDDCVRIRPDD